MEIDYKVSPTFMKIHQDTSRVKFVMGPVGSGKSSGCVFDLFFNAMQQRPDENGVRHSRYAVIRATYPQLRSSTIKTWIEWFKDKIKIVYTTPITGRIQYDLDDGTSIDMEIMFIAIEDEQAAERLRSWEFTGAWVNEAHEVPEYIMTILMQRTNRYPSMRSGGAVHPCILLDYNAVSTDHWLYRWAEETKPEGCSFYRQPPAMIEYEPGKYRINPEAENIEHLDASYYPNIVAVSSRESILTDILNQYGERKSGKPVYKDFDDLEHTMKEDMRPPLGSHVIVGIDQGLCYTDRVSCLTNKGWKLFKDIDITKDKVLSKDPATGIAHWVKPLRKIEEDHDGLMYRFKSNNAYFEVTPEHRIPYSTAAKPELRFAHVKDIIGKKVFVDVTSKFVGAKPKKLFGVDAFEYLKLLGWYLSEGSTDKNTNRISISNRNPDNLKEIARVVEAVRCTPRVTTQYVRFSNARLAKALSYKQGLFDTKHIPSWLYKLDKDYILTFIDAFTKGDGYIRTHKNGSVEHVCYTSSKALRDGLQTLAQLVGWYASWQETKPRHSWYKAEQRFIESKVSNYTVRFKKRTQKVQLLNDKWEAFHYKGKRYCLTTPYGTLYVRIDGIPSWNGNSPAAAFTFVDYDGALCVFDEITTQDCSLKEFAEELLWPLIHSKYPYIKDNFSCYVDPAAAQRSMNDAKAGYEILKEAGLPVKLARTNNPTDRRESVIHFLRLKNRFKLSPKCTVLRKGFISGYKYEEKRSVDGKTYKDKPMKNEFSHVHDALQYACLEYVHRKVRKNTYASRKSYSVASTIGGY